MDWCRKKSVGEGGFSRSQERVVKGEEVWKCFLSLAFVSFCRQKCLYVGTLSHAARIPCQVSQVNVFYRFGSKRLGDKLISIYPCLQTIHP